MTLDPGWKAQIRDPGPAKLRFSMNVVVIVVDLNVVAVVDELKIL